MRRIALFICVATALACGPSSNEPPAEVALTWDVVEEDGVVGYNVYRSEEPGRDYRRINSDPVAEPEYTDGSVERGATYYYRVTAVTASGLESGFSEERSKSVRRSP